MASCNINELLGKPVKRCRLTINAIVPDDMERIFESIANSKTLMQSKFLTRKLIQDIVIKYVETAKIEKPFTNPCEITCWWKKFIKFVDSTDNLLKLHPEWSTLLLPEQSALLDDDDDVSTILESDEETVIDTSDEKIPQTVSTLKRSFSESNSSDDEGSGCNTKFIGIIRSESTKPYKVPQNKPTVQVRLPQSVQPFLPRPQIFSNIFPEDFCRYDFNCLIEQCRKRHSPGVIPSRYNKMCRNGTSCNNYRCSYRH